MAMDSSDLVRVGDHKPNAATASTSRSTFWPSAATARSSGWPSAEIHERALYSQAPLTSSTKARCRSWCAPSGSSLEYLSCRCALRTPAGELPLRGRLAKWLKPPGETTRSHILSNDSPTYSIDTSHKPTIYRAIQCAGPG